MHECSFQNLKVQSADIQHVPKKLLPFAANHLAYGTWAPVAGFTCRFACSVLHVFAYFVLSLPYGQVGDASVEGTCDGPHGMTGTEWRVATALFTAGEVNATLW